MAKISGKSLNFDFVIENELASLQSFLVVIPPVSTTARSYRARQDSLLSPGVFPGDAFFTGDFFYDSPFVVSPDQVTGLISGFSFKYFPINSDGIGTGLSGTFQVDLGKDAIEFIDFIGLQPDALAARILRGRDNITGSAFDDLLDGYSGNDKIKGRNGNDQLIGSKGDDKLFGGNGIDIIEGGSGNDKLFGGNNTDRLIGGSGNDFLDAGRGAGEIFAGKGNDTVVFKRQKGMRGVVRDFNPIEDFIDIAGDGSQFDGLSAFQRDPATVVIEYNGSRNNFLILESDQAFTIDDVNFI